MGTSWTPAGTLFPLFLKIGADVQYPIKIFIWYYNQSDDYFISFFPYTANFLNKLSMFITFSCPATHLSPTQNPLRGSLYKNFSLEGHLPTCNCKIIESRNFRARRYLWYFFQFSHFTDEEGHTYNFTWPVVSFVSICLAVFDIVASFLFMNID